MSRFRTALFVLLTLGLIGSVSQVAPLLAQSNQQTGFFFGTNFMGTLKHWAGGSALVPTVSACGSSPTLASGSGDTAGDITLGSGVTNCVLTFGSAYVAAPTCVVMVSSGTSATQPQYVTSTTALHLNVGVASTKYSYHCIAKGAG